MQFKLAFSVPFNIGQFNCLFLPLKYLFESQLTELRSHDLFPSFSLDSIRNAWNLLIKVWTTCAVTRLTVRYLVFGVMLQSIPNLTLILTRESTFHPQ
jgi:hypothetical protein